MTLAYYHTINMEIFGKGFVIFYVFFPNFGHKLLLCEIQQYDFIVEILVVS